MNKLVDLVDQLCPSGVPYFELGELGTFYGGLTGKSSIDFIEGNAYYVSYNNVYNNPVACFSLEDKVKVKAGEKQTKLQLGDVIFTASSETREDSCMSSVVVDEPSMDVYLNSFCFVFRLNNPVLYPRFAVHLFRSQEIRMQLKKTVNGVTKYNVSKAKLKYVKIPIPPIQVQKEIADILDSFAEIKAGLEKEIVLRNKQFDYCCNKMISEMMGTALVPLRDLGHWSGGITPSMNIKEYWESGTIPWVSSKEVKTPRIYDTASHITENALKGTSIKLYPHNTLVVVTRSGILRHTLPFALLCTEATVNQDVKALITYEKIDPLYVYYAICAFKSLILAKTKKKGGTVDSLDYNKLLDYMIPVPIKMSVDGEKEFDIESQRKIVELLSPLFDYCSNPDSGLRAELRLREKQYFVYRDRLTSFAYLATEVKNESV